MIRTILSALCLTAAIVSAAPALAQEDVSIHVSYADLNLASPAGAAVFHQRLDNAVTTICGRPGGRDLGQATIVKACRDNTGLTASRLERQAIAAAEQKVQLASARTEAPVR
jgi:UrcA family protein